MFGIWRRLVPALTAMIVAVGFGSVAYAQNSNPANGIGWNPGPTVLRNQQNNTGVNPAPAQSNNPANGIGWNPGSNAPGGGPANGIGWNPGPGFQGNWGSPWNNGWNNSPTIIVNQVPTIPNQGVTKVVACGYDSEGIWRVLPLTVSFQYNGVQYDVYVLNAWNPWTDQWDRGVDVPAYNTSYYMRGQEYDFYTVLPTGTYYFNL